MNGFTRRQALGAPVGVALGTVSAVPAAASDDPPGESAPLVLGPFAIDRWFLRAVRTAPLGGHPLTAPRHEDVAKALADCRVYVLDRRVGPAGRDARFAGAGWPKLATEGKWFSEWRDGGKAFTLLVADVSVGGTSTVHGRGLPYRELGRVTVSVRLRGSDGRDSADAAYNFSSDLPAVVYDVTGATRGG